MVRRPTPTNIIHVLARNAKAEKHSCWAGLYFSIQQGLKRSKKSPREFPAGCVIAKQHSDLIEPALSAQIHSSNFGPTDFFLGAGLARKI